MQPKRPKLLIVCTDLATIRAINDAASRHFEIFTARDLNALNESIKHDPAPTAVIIDNGVPQVPAIQALDSVRRACPNSRRILITDYCDLALIVQGLHTGEIERIVYKPIHGPEVLAAIGAENLPVSAVTPAVQAPRAAQTRVG